ncbi:MAG: type II secretion system protein GspL [Pseudomonadaceae bacterium]|nr:type II secretion system protein GspL [Pseudomonadaceae bacterium]
MPRLFLRVLSQAVPLSSDGDIDSESPLLEGYDLGVEWLIKENDGSVRGTGVTDYRGLADIADPNIDWLKDPENTVVLLPSQFVLMVTCDVPGRSTAQIRRALPFAVEEFVATDIELMHIAHAGIKAGQPVRCNIVAHETIVNWLACFKSIGVNPGYFVADSQVLPTDSNSASVLFEGSTALVAAEDQAAVVDLDNLVFALNSLDVSEISVINGELSPVDQGLLENHPTVIHADMSPHGVLDYLADQFGRSGFINLLQGPYTPVRPKSAHAGKWQGVGTLAAVWLLVAFVGMVAQGFWASTQADRLQEESFAFYKNAFPRESQPNTVDQLRRRMRAKLGQSNSAEENSAFVGLTAQFANVMTSSGRVDSLSYTQQREELTVEVLLDSFDDLESLKGKLAQAGIALEVVSSESEDAGARSRLRMRYES